MKFVSLGLDLGDPLDRHRLAALGREAVSPGRHMPERAAAVGDDKGFPLYAFLRYEPSERLTVGLLAGVTFAGELKLEDSDGRLISETDYDPAGFIGAAFRLTF